MSEPINAQAYARKILSVIEKRSDQEAFPIPCGNLKIMCNAIINGAPIMAQRVKREIPEDAVPVKEPQAETLKLLKQAEGELLLVDLQLALGQKNIGTTTTMINGMVKKKQVVFDKASKKVSLPA